MSENDIGQGGLRGVLSGRELGRLYPEENRQRPRGVEPNPAVTEPLLNGNQEDLYAALAKQKRERKGR